MPELFANAAESTIENSGGITSTGTSITLATGDGAKFPAASASAGWFRALLYDVATSAVVEYVTVTNRTGDVLTVVRESEDATRFPKAARAQGVKVVAVATAQVLRNAFAAGGGDYFRSGYYSLGVSNSASTSSTAPAVNGIALRPFHVPVRRAFDRIGINVVTAATAGSGGVLRMGIYADGGGIPGALVVDGGTVSSESTGAKEVTISVTLEPGTYWIAVVAQVAACTITTFSSTTGFPSVSGSTTPPSAATGFGYFFISGGASGALPGTVTVGAVGAGSAGPAACLRAA